MSDEGNELLAWCVVANVADPLRHFAPGARVWVLPAFSRNGDQRLFVVGHHRAGKRYVRMIVERRHLTDFRVRGIYSPGVLRRIMQPHRDPRLALRVRLWDSREQAQRSADHWNATPAV